VKTIQEFNETNYKYVVPLIMGNIYRIMKEITLTCRLFRDIEANSEKFEIKILTSNISFKLEDKIMQYLREKNNAMVLNIKAKDLEIWKVNISNHKEEDFLKLVLKSNNKGDIMLIRGTISDYWEEPLSCENFICYQIIDQICANR
jgi:hypothetical protein